jgi:hypothetical protein
MRKICLLLFLTCIAVRATAELDLPKAPSGYTWIKILNNQSALLQPDGWFFKEVHPKDTDAYFLTKEDIDKDGKFSTGLSLNVLYHIDKKTGIPPSKYAQTLIKNMPKKDAREVVRSSEDKAGPFIRLMCLVRDKHPEEGNTFIHYLFIANDQTGTLWMYSFESPEKEWNDAWETGDVMLNFVVVESEI